MDLKRKYLAKVDANINEIGLLVSGGASLASIVLSNVLNLIPCELCWWQRVMMFALPVIFAVGILRNEAKSYLYALPFIIAGWLISLYQSLLQWGIIDLNPASCSITGISCSEPSINIFGFLTIPFGAFLMFSGLGWLMWRQRSLTKPEKYSSRNQTRLLKILVFLAALTVLAVIIVRALDIEVV